MKDGVRDNYIPRTSQTASSRPRIENALAAHGAHIARPARGGGGGGGSRAETAVNPNTSLDVLNKAVMDLHVN